MGVDRVSLRTELAVGLALALMVSACAGTSKEPAYPEDDPEGMAEEPVSGDTSDEPVVADVKRPAGTEVHDPVVCTDSDMEVIDAFIKTDGDGITVRGDCNIRVRGSTIVAGRFGILIQGTGSVIIEGSDVRGVSASVAIPGMGSVKARNTRFKGFVSETGGGGVEDGGGNSFD